MSVFEAVEAINRLRELQKNNALPAETLIELDRFWREVIFGNSIPIDHREIAQDYYIKTL